MSHGWKENSMLVKRLAVYTNLSSTVSEIYQVIGRKSRHFHTPPLLGGPAGVNPFQFRNDIDTHKTRMNGLSCGEEIMTIRSAVLIQYQRVTDERTDGCPAYIYYVLQLQHCWRTKKGDENLQTCIKSGSSGVHDTQVHVRHLTVLVYRSRH